MTTKILLKLAFLLFCAIALLNLTFGRSFSMAISRSLFVCLVASGWGLGIWVLYSKMAASVAPTDEEDAEIEPEEDLDESASPDE